MDAEQLAASLAQQYQPGSNPMAIYTSAVLQAEAAGLRPGAAGRLGERTVELVEANAVTNIRHERDGRNDAA